MLINLVFYENEAVTKIIKKTAEYFKNDPNFRISDNTIWLGYMYIKFGVKYISINIYNEKIDWKPIVREYLRIILENEEVFISSNNNGKSNSQYFERVTSESDIESIYLNENKDNIIMSGDILQGSNYSKAPTAEEMLKGIKIQNEFVDEHAKVNIFIDDERECPEEFLCARTFEEANELLLKYKGKIEYVTLDNDLGQGFDKCGMCLFPFMKENKIFPPQINCHTGSFPEMMAEEAKKYFPEETIITARSIDFIRTLKF